MVYLCVQAILHFFFALNIVWKLCVYTVHISLLMYFISPSTLNCVCKIVLCINVLDLHLLLLLLLFFTSSFLFPPTSAGEPQVLAES